MNSQDMILKGIRSPLAMYKAKFCQCCSDCEFCRVNVDQVYTCMLAALLDTVNRASSLRRELQ